MQRELNAKLVLQEAVDILNAILERMLNISHDQTERMIVVLLRIPSAALAFLTQKQ